MSDWTDNQTPDSSLIYMPKWAIAVIMVGCLALGGLVGDLIGQDRTQAHFAPQMIDASNALAYAEGSLDMCHEIMQALNSDGKFFVINAPVINGPGGG